MATLIRSLKRAVPDSDDLRVAAYGFIGAVAFLTLCVVLGSGLGLFWRMFLLAAYGG